MFLTCLPTKVDRRRRRRIPQAFLLFLLTQERADSLNVVPPPPSSRSALLLQHNILLTPSRRATFRAVPSSSYARTRYRLDVANTSVEDGPVDDDDSISSKDETRKNYGWNQKNFQLAVPALIGMLADPLLSLMDTAYVGRVGSKELAALGACTSIFHLAFNAFRATTAATTSLVATSLQSDEESAKQVTSISLWFGWWMGLAVSASLLVGGKFFLKSMGIATTSELYPAASSYLFTRAWAAPCVLLMMVAEGAFRGYGDTVIPLIASLVASAVNLVLDPLLMFKAGWGVKGAAAATALAQVGAAITYAYHLLRRHMLPSFRWRNSSSSGTSATAVPAATSTSTQQPSQRSVKEVVQAIIGANLAMLMKQGSLLLGWAYATARATRLGSNQVAAHQVALSVWLIFALVQDGAAVAAQVLMSRAYAARDAPQAKSLVKYMIKFAVAQGVAAMVILDGIDMFVPRAFTPDKEIRKHLHKLMGPLSLQQVLVSLTLVMESLAIGANQFQILGVGSVLSTIASVWVTKQQQHVQSIWAYGITTLFGVRLLMAVLALLRARLNLKNTNTASATELGI